MMRRWTIGAVALVTAVLSAGGSTSAAAATVPTEPATEGTIAPVEPATPGTITPAPSPDQVATPTGAGEGFTSGPVITSSVPRALPGERVILTIDGFESSWVTVSVCGNEARRGSGDCNLTGSVTNEFNEAGDPMALSYVVTAPPTECPCVIRAVGRDTSEIAVTSFVVTDHPLGPLRDPDVVGDLFSVTISARTAATGALDAIRAEMGGPTTYEVTVRVTNTTTTPLRQVRVSGSVGPNTQESLTTLELDDPGLIGVGQTWEQTVIAVVPAPSFGTYQWQVAVSGAGPTVVATSTSSHRPWLLIVLVMVIAINLCLVFLRFWARRRARTEAGEQAGDSIHVTPDAVSSSADPARVSVGVGSPD